MTRDYYHPQKAATLNNQPHMIWFEENCHPHTAQFQENCKSSSFNNCYSPMKSSNTQCSQGQEKMIHSLPVKIKEKLGKCSPVTYNSILELPCMIQLLCCGEMNTLQHQEKRLLRFLNEASHFPVYNGLKSGPSHLWRQLAWHPQQA